MKASKVLTLSVSVFRGQILWHFSLSKNIISPAVPDLELILFPLWYWPIMNAHTKQQQDKVFETDFIDSQKSDPPFAHLLALSNLHTSINYNYIFKKSSKPVFHWNKQSWINIVSCNTLLKLQWNKQQGHRQCHWLKCLIFIGCCIPLYLIVQAVSR